METQLEEPIGVYVCVRVRLSLCVLDNPLEFGTELEKGRLIMLWTDKLDK